MWNMYKYVIVKLECERDTRGRWNVVGVKDSGISFTSRSGSGISSAMKRKLNAAGVYLGHGVKTRSYDHNGNSDFSRLDTMFNIVDKVVLSRKSDGFPLMMAKLVYSTSVTFRTRDNEITINM